MFLQNYDPCLLNGPAEGGYVLKFYGHVCHRRYFVDLSGKGARCVIGGGGFPASEVILHCISPILIIFDAGELRGIHEDECFCENRMPAFLGRIIS